LTAYGVADAARSFDKRQGTESTPAKIIGHLHGSDAPIDDTLTAFVIAERDPAIHHCRNEDGPRVTRAGDIWETARLRQ
jgi:hypothetical protein